MLLNIHPTARLFVQSIAALAAIAGIATLLLSDEEQTSWPANNNLRPNERRYLASLPDPKSTQMKQAPRSLSRVSPDEPIKVNVYVAHPQKVFESRFFDTDTTVRYGTGRVHYNVVEHGEMKMTSDTGPCIAIGHHAGKRWSQEDFDALEKHYPNCKYMNTNDERCEAPDQFNFRQYYSAKKTGHYIPLGMRYDSWNSFRKIRAQPGFEIKPPSQRKYAFNSMISLSTNWERQDLAKILEKEEKDGARGMSTFVALQKNWSPRRNTYQYMQVLLDSTFTLNPTGHNPECFRLYEAIEAGSIPILVKGNWRKCENAMKYWYEAPMLYLDKWEDLYPTVKSLMNNPVLLDEMMVKLKLWYDEFMEKTVVDVEDYMIESYYGNGGLVVSGEEEEVQTK